MTISAKEAADLVGMSKAGIFKAIKTGKVSATKNGNGEWRIEPVELFRVYQPVSNGLHQSPLPSVQQDIPQSTGSLQREVDLLREMVTDLRSRLDEEIQERRKLTNILTETHSPTQAVAPERKRSWWVRLFGGE